MVTDSPKKVIQEFDSFTCTATHLMRNYKVLQFLCPRYSITTTIPIIMKQAKSTYLKLAVWKSAVNLCLRNHQQIKIIQLNNAIPYKNSMLLTKINEVCSFTRTLAFLFVISNICFM